MDALLNSGITAGLVSVAWKSVLIIGTGLVCAFFMRRSIAAIRYAIWKAVFIALALLPLCVYVIPGWKVPIRTWAIPAAVATPSNSPVTDFQPRVPAHTETDMSVHSTLTTTDQGEFFVTNTLVSLRNQHQAPTHSPEIVVRTKPVSWTHLIQYLWIGGFLLLLIRVGIGRFQAHSLVAGSEACADDGWHFVLQKLSRFLGLTRSIRLLRNRRVHVPLTFGLRQPVVMLPRNANAWTVDRRRVVLMHEFVHIKRKDDLVRLLARVVASVYWFNPLAWIAFRNLKMEQERTCDELVLASGIRASDYARHLVDLAADIRKMPLACVATLGMARKAELQGRLSEILTNKKDKRDMSMKMKWFLSIVLLCGLVSIAVMQPVAEAASFDAQYTGGGIITPADVNMDKVKTASAPPVVPTVSPRPDTEEAPKPVKPAEPAKPADPAKPAEVTKKVYKVVDSDKDQIIVLTDDGSGKKKIRMNVSTDCDVKDAHVMRFNVQFSQSQIEAAMAEVKKAMKILETKRLNLETLNSEMTKELSSLKIDDAKIRDQVAKTLAKVSAQLKKDMANNAEAMARLAEASEKLKTDMKMRPYKYKFISKPMDMDKMKWKTMKEMKNHEKEIQLMITEEKARAKELSAKAHEEAFLHQEKLMKMHEKELKELEKELARDQKKYKMVWIEKGDVDEGADVSIDDKMGNVFLIDQKGDDAVKIKLMIKMKDISKADRKAIDKALSKLKKSVPEAVKLKVNKTDTEYALDMNVPKGQKLTDKEEKALNKALDTFMDKVHEIKGDKDSEVHRIRIRKDR